MLVYAMSALQERLLLQTGELHMQIDKRGELRSDFEFEGSDTQPIHYDDDYDQNGVTVTLDSDVATDFPSAESVNQALRVLSRITKTYKAEISAK